MALVTIVTRDVPDRFRGFLGSVMPEVAPCTYVSPWMSKGVRERVWSVLSDWHASIGEGSIVMVWADSNATGGVGISYLGTPSKELVDLDGLWIVRKS